MVKRKRKNRPSCGTNRYGTKRWILNGQLHREDGPAMEYIDGTKYWYFHGQLHRLDGPAVEYPNGIKFWYYHGKCIDCSSQRKFKRLLKLKFLW